MAYVCTVTLATPRVERVSRNLGMICGVADVSSYHATEVEVTDITRYFTSVLCVVCDGVSDLGFWARWNATNKAFTCYKAAGTAQDNDTDNGAIYFVALGLI